MNWNLETFFDGEFDGNEYSDFSSPKSGWSKEKYEIRLNRLANVIKTLDADIVIMEEIEKQEQIYDISNRLAGTFDFNKSYRYALFSKKEGSSIGCAVISRLPLSEFCVHSLSITSQKREQPSMRPIIEFSVSKNNRNLTFFVNHWKSKSDGEAESEVWRNFQENQLSRLMQKSLGEGKAVIALGDFNRDIKEFSIIEKKENEENQAHKENIMLGKKHGGRVEVYSPWIDSPNESGSYFYDGHWERIDHFFAAGGVQIHDFKNETDGEWCTNEGLPKNYRLWNGSGYSDHLPLTCVLEW